MYAESTGYYLVQNYDYAEMEFPPHFSLENYDQISNYTTNLLFVKYS